MSRPKPPFPFLDRSHALAAGLVGAWAFYEGSGDKLYDLSGNGNDGTLINMDPATDWVAGQHGWALDLDAVDDAVTVQDSPSLTPANGLSMVVLLKRSRIATREWPVSKAAGTISTNAYIVEINSSNQLRNAVSNGSSQGTAIHTDLLLDSTDRWYHCALTWDGATVRGYLDGVLSSVTASVSGPVNDNTDLLRFSRAALPNLPFSGQFAKALIYNRALSPAEVEQLYHDPFSMYRRRRVWVRAAAAPLAGGLLLLEGLFVGSGSGGLG